jgi:hypothetical protein
MRMVSNRPLAMADVPVCRLIQMPLPRSKSWAVLMVDGLPLT